MGARAERGSAAPAPTSLVEESAKGKANEKFYFVNVAAQEDRL
jgi:hypothetical protein